MSTTDSIRDAFEAHWPNAAKERDGDTYDSTIWECRWEGWQAATEAAKATGTAGEVEHIHSLSEQADIGKRIRRVAKAAGYEPDGTDEFYYAAAFAILGRAADALESAARQSAPVVAVKRWEDRVTASGLPASDAVYDAAKTAEIDALRAALAATAAPVELSYLQLLAIADDSEAHEALQGFSEDPTQDNGVCVVRAILAATNRSQP